MSRPDLTPFSFVVLLLVGRDGAGPHDLVRMSRRGRIYGEFADSQWYSEPRRLERLGYLTSRVEPGRTRPRTHYELTPKAYEALTRWAAEPSPFSKIQLDPAHRLLAADLVGEEAVLEGLRGLGAHIDELRKQLNAADETASAVPHREAYLKLNHRLARKIVQAHAEWLDEVERELGKRRRPK